MPQGGKLKSNPHKAKSTTQKKQQPKKGRQSLSLSRLSSLNLTHSLSSIERAIPPKKAAAVSQATVHRVSLPRPHHHLLCTTRRHSDKLTLSTLL